MGGNDVPLSSDLLSNVDYVSPNQTELARIVKSVTKDNLTDME